MAEAGKSKIVWRVVYWGFLIAIGVALGLALKKSPPPDIPYDPQASARAEQKFAAADQAKAAGQPAEVQLNPVELNSYLQQNLQTQNPAANAPASGASPAGTSAAPNSSGLPEDPNATLEQVQSSVKDVKVDMDGDLVKAYVVFDVHGKDMSLELDGHLGSENGYMKFIPVAGKLGSMPLPQSVLEAAVEKLMNSPENREKLKLPADINDIHVQDGHAVVSYK